MDRKLLELLKTDPRQRAEELKRADITVDPPKTPIAPRKLTLGDLVRARNDYDR